MSDTPGNNLQRLHDLLAEQATAGLTDVDRAELQSLLIENANQQREGYELAAAAVDLALAPPDAEPLPASVRKQALSKASVETEPEPESEPAVYKLTEERPAAAIRRPSTPRTSATAAEAPAETYVIAGPPESSRGTGWLVAASMIGVAVLMYVAGRSGGTKPTAPRGPEPVIIAQAPKPSCDALKEGDPDVLILPCTATDDTLGDVAGEIRFSAKLQQGCMVLKGLPKLDPAQAVYQLWVVDANRQGPPVDAGLFEVTGDTRVDEQIVFNPRLTVSKPVVFAVTREAPGGVVKSDKQPIMVAKLGA